MRQTDVLIAGGGLAGSLAAAMLRRAGIDAIMADPHATYPVDFRCEKLDRVQLERFRMTGVDAAVLRESTPDRNCWVARFGRHIDTIPMMMQRGVAYETLVNAVRSQIPDDGSFIVSKVSDVTTGPDRQTVKLSNGEEISARLVVLSTGLNIGLQHKLGVERKVFSATHSICIGFDVQPAGGSSFPFTAMTYFAEKPENCAAYITLFPVGGTMRANLFVYRDLQDPWLVRFRTAPVETLNDMWPGLRKLMGDFTVPSQIKIRPADLYVSAGHRQDGVVLVGDAFSTSCPVAGTGARKALVDVERLCNVYIPQWLATPGMDAAKTAMFYDDPDKLACDAFSARKAFELRSSSINPGLRWAAMRWAKFAVNAGRGIVHRLSAASPVSVEEAMADDTPIWSPHTPAHK
ncbi:MAG: NAD(P)/FAD-dependent oxidoreductase [Hyphomicrobiales bacterium]